MPLVKSGTELTYVTRAVEVLFTETTGAGVYTGSVSLPAGSTLEDRSEERRVGKECRL